MGSKIFHSGLPSKNTIPGHQAFLTRINVTCRNLLKAACRRITFEWE